MMSFTASTIRDRTLMLLRIERIQYCEQMALLGYAEEKTASTRRGRLVRRETAALRKSRFQLFRGGFKAQPNQ